MKNYDLEIEGEKLEIMEKLCSENVHNYLLMSENLYLENHRGK
jgi:hypothetical protein